MDANERLRGDLLQEMSQELTGQQIEALGDVLTRLLSRYEITEKQYEVGFLDGSNESLKKKFIGSLRLEGKSEQTLDQYGLAIDMMLSDLGKNISDITTNDIRYHLAMYQSTRNVSKLTVDNKRRNLSSFFAWLTREEYIEKNPMLRIKKIKSEAVVKLPFSDNDLERLKNAAGFTRNRKRDRALIELLLSTGCRVSEVVHIDLIDVDAVRKEIIVTGKGNKQRKVYLSDKALYYLNEYISSRRDNHPALFVNRSGQRWSKQSIEKLLHTIGDRAGVDNVHPHRFRRTFATNALTKGMPVQYLQKILGHRSLDTTMIYCTVDDDSIKFEHRKIA